MTPCLLSLSFKVSIRVQFVTEVFTHQSLNIVLLLVLRNGQFSPLCRVFLSRYLQSLCYHRRVSYCFSFPDPGWPLPWPAGAAAALLYLHQDLRKGHKKM